VPDTSPPLARFETAARSAGWTSLFPALQDLCQATIGHRLFSCSSFCMDGPQSGVAARVHTSDAVHYPQSGLKEIQRNRWTEQVVARHQVFVANDVAGFADVFPDHDLIASLGLGSVVNLPVILRGAFIGTVNMLHEPGYYTAERLRALPSLGVPALLAFSVAAETQA
jgi:hypothetical protein